jgi:hypothetical protein
MIFNMSDYFSLLPEDIKRETTLKLTREYYKHVLKELETKTVDIKNTVEYAYDWKWSRPSPCICVYRNYGYIYYATCCWSMTMSTEKIRNYCDMNRDSINMFIDELYKKYGNTIDEYYVVD